MKKNFKISPKYLLIYSMLIFFLLVLLPMASIKFFYTLIPEESKPQNTEIIPETVHLYMTKQHIYKDIPFEKYIEGVVASEMPKTFSLEALKAQSVASRTYAMGKIKSGGKLCDSSHCQVYRSDNISAKIKKAVKATAGELLFYKGKIASHSLYFASSGGFTENSEDVFSSPIPYLTSVKSPYENKATHKKEKLTLSISSFSKKLKSFFPEKIFGPISQKNIKIISRSKGKRVSKILVGKITLKGTEFRSALGLYSTLFNIKIKKDKLTITSSGSGHGVGMSQYGADGFANKGYSYKEILEHYYRGVTIK